MWRSISLAAAMALLLACASKSPSTAPSTPPARQPAPQAAAAGARLGAEQLDELVARVALYPDELLALVLPASTQPTQTFEAARFLEARRRDPQLTPMEGWDEAVRSLLNYPEVIRSMSEDPQWTQALGGAVSSQQADVMEAIQQVRTRALAAGNLKTNEQQVVIQEQGIIRIQSADPKVIYVPIYDPIVIYVASPEPVVTYYPPYPCYWCPSAAFGMGMMMGFDWYYHDIYYDYDHDDDVDIDIDIDRPDRPERPDRPDRPTRPDHPDRPGRPDHVWKPSRPGGGPGGTNRPAGPTTLPARPGVDGGGSGLGATGRPVSVDRLTTLPSGYMAGYQKPSPQDSLGGYERGRDAMRDSNRGAQSRGLPSRNSPSYGDRSARSGSSWGGYGRGSSADAWSSRGASSRGGMRGGGGRGGSGGGGRGGGRGGGGRGR